MLRLALLACVAAVLVIVSARYEERYDRSKMPFDLRPVQNIIGLWSLSSKSGSSSILPPPDQIDFAINPLPKFGARALNITHTFYGGGGVLRHDYGYMPVKNSTRRDTRIHVAYLTTSSEGWSMMEQGQVRGNKITFHLKQFLSRSFGVANGNLEIRERPYALTHSKQISLTTVFRENVSKFERQIEQPDYNNLVMRIRAETSRDVESYTAYYRRVMG